MRHENFDLFLDWLSPDRDEAARKYETVRAGLMRVFTTRGCRNVDELADETIDRVMGKGAEFFRTYEGNPVYYFYSVAQYLLREYHKQKPPPESLDGYRHLPAPEPVEEGPGLLRNCLDDCLRQLPPEIRAFILRYYRASKHEKVELHQQMAQEEGVTKQKLRARVFRLKKTLEKCVNDCLAKK